MTTAKLFTSFHVLVKKHLKKSSQDPGKKLFLNEGQKKAFKKLPTAITKRKYHKTRKIKNFTDSSIP